MEISWDATGERHYSIGVDRGVLYLQNGSGIPWNGLVSVNETPSDDDVKEGHYDGRKFFSRRRGEGYSATIEAVTYPTEFEEYDGQSLPYTNQRRKPFGFSYRTFVGNDEGTDGGYLIHVVYNALAAPSERGYQSVDDSSEFLLFSWEVTTTPVEIGNRYGSHLIIDTRIAYSWAVSAIEAQLYGSVDTEAHLPTPEEILELFEDSAILVITDHGDGTWTAEGPDEAIQMLDPTSFQITWPSAIYIDDETYTIGSL